MKGALKTSLIIRDGVRLYYLAPYDQKVLSARVQAVLRKNKINTNDNEAAGNRGSNRGDIPPARRRPYYELRIGDTHEHARLFALAS